MLFVFVLKLGLNGIFSWFMINNGLFIRGVYSLNSDLIWYLNGTPPIEQPFGVYESRVDITQLRVPTVIFEHYITYDK